MICIQSVSYDPRFNLAAEEYLLKHTGQEFFMLYRDQSSVIIGKHQNALAEINPLYLRETGIPLVRRITGGGSVYHDLGNLNYSFIRNGIRGQLVDFQRHTQPLIDFLAGLGLDCVSDGRNSLLLHGRKISGNAEHVFRERVLHHGTVLFSTDLQQLSESLKARDELYQDKAIRSRRSPVTNLCEYIGDQVDIELFSGMFMEYIRRAFPGSSATYRFTSGDTEEIDRLVAEKYGTWEWNYGYSPAYTFSNSLVLSGKQIRINLSVENGHIKELELSGGGVDSLLADRLKSLFAGLPHDYHALSRQVSYLPEEFPATERDVLIAGFF